MFDFNSHNLQTGSKIVSSKGTIIYTVLNAFVPPFETPSSEYLNCELWLRVQSIDESVFTQPIQWFNAVIGANEGMTVNNEGVHHAI